MEGQLIAAALGGIILIMGVGVGVWSRTGLKASRLQSIGREIDRMTALKNQDVQTQTLGGQFNVAPWVVRDLCAAQGWGETTIELAMAHRLTQIDSEAYPDTKNALGKVAMLRHQKRDWGKIAKSLDLELGPVINAAEHAHNELRREFPLANRPAIQKTEPRPADFGGQAYSQVLGERLAPGTALTESIP